MFLRTAAFLAFQGAGALLGWLLSHQTIGALWGGLAGAMAWFLLDTSRASQTLQWLRPDRPESPPLSSGLWGEVLDRARHLLRSKEREIIESDHRLQDFLSAMQASPNGVILLNSKSQIEWCNETAATHFGLDPQRDVAQAISNLVRDPGFVAYLAHRSFGQELLMPGRDSTFSRPVRLSVQLYHYGGGRMLLLSHDVTALEQAEAMRRDFVANVSHEIRTPLTVLAGFVETLQTLDLEPTELESYLALMAQQAQRMQSLVNDLLMLSKLEGSSVPGVDTWTSVPSLMQQLSQDAHALTSVINSGEQRVHDLDFDCRFSGEIAGIATELHSAMGNLVSNAIRYTPSGGHIRVSFCQLPDGQAVFEVTDSGGGIAPEHLPRLTERFYRVDRSRSRETGGTGLGLAIVKHVVQRHGATLTMDSKLGQGSTFRIHFPAARLRSALQ